MVESAKQADRTTSSISGNGIGPVGPALFILGGTPEVTTPPMSLVLDILIFAVAWTHVLLSPYTKVEESFNLHAIHDLLFYGGHPDALQKVRNGLVILSRHLIRPILFPSLTIKSFLEPYPAHLWIA